MKSKASFDDNLPTNTIESASASCCAAPTSKTDGPQRNHLLAALPAAVFTRLSPHLERVSLRLGEVLYEYGDHIQHIYFPTTSIISQHCVMEDGASAEIAGVGNEGMFGISLFMGGDATSIRAVVQTAGHAYGLQSRILKDEFNLGGAAQRLLLRYSHALITQVAQTAACNRHHTVEQQLSRWLLLTLDRVPSNDLVITQELIASILGVRRESVTEAAGKLKQSGVISWGRGHITVLDRARLNNHVCECYDVVKTEFNRLYRDVRSH